MWQKLTRLPLKATGSDGIPAIIYKRSALILADPIFHLISESIRQRKFPTSWKIADVVPVPKSGSNSHNAFRPISLLPVPAKMAEWFIVKDLRTDLSRLLGESQFGIRKNSSTTDAIIAAHDALTRHADDPKFGASILIEFDFSKAYDKVLHQHLLNLIVTMDLPSGFSALIEDYLHQRQQRVRLGGYKSKLRDVSSGVPQGSILGPYLFGLFVSTLQPRYHSTLMLKYVDDVCLVAGIRKESPYEDIDMINDEVSEISRWAKANGLVLNDDKTTGLIHYRGSFKSSVCIESLVPSVSFKSCVRLLGVFIDDSLGWKSHVKYIQKKCAQRMYILRRIRSVVNDADFLMIYCCLVRSLIEYECPAFIGLSAEDAKILQRIQNRCLKIKGSLKLDDLNVRRQMIASKLFLRLPVLETVLRQMAPSSLPSGRFSIPFCSTVLRRKSFIPTMSIFMSCTHCD